MSLFQKISLFILLFLLLLPSTTLAVDLQSQLGAAAGNEGAGFSNPTNPLLSVAYGIRLSLGLLGILFLVYTLYAGFLIMTSRGEEEKVTEGKKTLQRAVIGIVVIMSAYSITLLAEKIATGDAKHQGDYIEIQDTDVDFHNTDPSHDVKKMGCQFGLTEQPDGSCGEYENAP